MYQDENKIAINKTKKREYVLVNLDKRSSLWLIRWCFIFIRIWFRLVILETWSLVQDANDALSRIKVSGATPAVECNHVKGTTRYPSLVDEYISHSSDAFSVFHLLNSLLCRLSSLSLSLSLPLSSTTLRANTRCSIYRTCTFKYSIFIAFCFLPK